METWVSAMKHAAYGPLELGSASQEFFRSEQATEVPPPEPIHCHLENFVSSATSVKVPLEQVLFTDPQDALTTTTQAVGSDTAGFVVVQNESATTVPLEFLQLTVRVAAGHTQLLVDHE